MSFSDPGGVLARKARRQKLADRLAAIAPQSLKNKKPVKDKK